MEKTDVVIVDDDDGIRWVLKEMLELENISSVDAGDGPGGIELVKKHKPGLAILDVKLGAMSGIDVAWAIRDGGLDTPILFLTGYADSVNEKTRADLKIHGIMEKPFEMEALISVVKNALNTSS